MSVLRSKIILKWKDQEVARVDTVSQNFTVIDAGKLPFPLRKADVQYSDFIQFCCNRVLLINRKYFKDIVTICGIEDRSPFAICLAARGLTLRDFYWFDWDGSGDRWESVNLFQNEFSQKIAMIALTGGMENDLVFSDQDLYTGELTSMGTKAKSFHKMANGGILLMKEETYDEITSEVLAYYVGTLLGLPMTHYQYANPTVQGRQLQCSVCQLQTSITREMIPCRDIMLRFDESLMSFSSRWYNFFMINDPIQFMKMQLFDYITLNVDRNRDNFALTEDGSMYKIYPLFDHDSCYKGKSEKAQYFVTGFSFDDSLSLLKNFFGNTYAKIQPDLKKAYKKLTAISMRNTFIKLKGERLYEETLARLRRTLT